MLPLALPYFLANGRDLEILGIVLGLVFWLGMIRHCLLYDSGPGKLTWLMIMLLLPGLGSLLYFFCRVSRPRF